MKASLWTSTSLADWTDALGRYESVVARQGVKPLADLDRWYRQDLPDAIAARRVPHVTHAEIVKIAEWKMARGVWRARNLALVRGNDAKLVVQTSTDALAKI